jgi:hypothetical protein
MFYLVMQSEHGHRLIDFSDRTADLMKQITELLKDEAAGVPVIFNDESLRAAYMVDDFGIVVQENDGYLVQLTDLL